MSDGSTGGTAQELAVVLLVDASGRLLLQLRDRAAPNWPGVWGCPGGHVEPGEAPDDAAVRELFEETGLRAELTPYATQRLPELGRTKHYFCGATTATQDDVVLGEGEAMCFVPAAEVLDGRPYTPGTAEMLARFLDSPRYRDLAGGAGGA